jgi:endonuclease YncB( thermonuclease family)
MIATDAALAIANFFNVPGIVSLQQTSNITRDYIKLALRGKSMISRMATALLLSVGAVSSADEVRAIDGDTIRIGRQKPDVRLVGFNAPETRRAICEAERELGDKATRRLRDLVQTSKLDFEFVACACQPAEKEHHPAITEGVAALSKQMVVTSALS